MMSCDKRISMNLNLNSTEVQRSRTMSLSDLVFDELLSPMKTSSGNFRGISAAMTPTPTQFLFPTSVTAEQEAYASGFVRALEEIYRSEGQPANQPKMVSSTVHTPSTSSQLTMLNNVERCHSFTCPPSYSQATTGICSNVIWPGSKAEDSVRNTRSSHTQSTKSYLSYLPTANCFETAVVAHPAKAASSSAYTRFPGHTSTLKVDNCNQHTNWHDMMVPGYPANYVSVGADNHSSMSAAADSTVSCAPSKVDMDEQDHWRLERKRAKNRVAAARCQMRKMERITRLQEKVQELRDNNARLSQMVAELTNHVSTLRKQILMHTERGCRMMIPALS